MRILYVDSLQTEPYGLRHLETRGLGGAQSAALRVLDALSSRYDVTFAQKNRNLTQAENAGIRYVPLADVYRRQIAVPDVILCNRKIKLVSKLQKLYPQAKIYVWIHNFLPLEQLAHKWLLRRAGATLVCVSDYHRRDTDRLLNGGPLSRLGRSRLRFRPIPVVYVHNPIDGMLSPDATSVDKNKLLYFSAPGKGLAEILQKFKSVRAAIPQLRLHIATPDYAQRELRELLASVDVDADGVCVLGSLSHEQIIEQLRSSLCVFYPQMQFRETFGLIYAEANAVGTPVLAHDIGAAREVLCPANPLIDCSNERLIIDTLNDWRMSGRPQPAARPQFQVIAVARHWHNLLQAEGRRHSDGVTVNKVSAHSQ